MVSNNFIVFEGVDGSGKSTQIDKLLDRLNHYNLRYSLYREPGGEPFSEKIREILLDKSLEINDRSEMLLFLAARAQLVNSMIHPDIMENKIVICDRFCDSTLVYQGYGKLIDKKLINLCNDFVTDQIKPKLTIILDVSCDVAIKRIGKNKDRMENNSKNFFRNVILGYRELAERYPEKYFLVDGSLPVETIHETIWNKLSKILSIDHNE